MDIFKTFSKKDLIELLEINNQALAVSNEEEFKKNVMRVQNLIPFEFALCALGRLLQGAERTVDILNTARFNDRIFSQNLNQIDPVLLELYENFDIQCWQTLHKKYQIKEIISLEQDEFGTNNGLTYGVTDNNKIYGAIFSFAGKQMKIDDRTKAIIQTVVPHLALGIEKLEKKEKKKKIIHSLTKREVEILKWLKEGKSSFETSGILHISERTVNFHVNNIKIKLDAVNRVQAVAIALDNKIINW